MYACTLLVLLLLMMFDVEVEVDVDVVGVVVNDDVVLVGDCC